MWRAISIAVISELALSGCNTTGGTAPALVTYSADQQRQAAAELRGLPKGSQIGVMIVDYGKLRKAVRVSR